MDKIAFVFSGQGAQYAGMGKELFDCSPAAQEIFTIVDEIRPGTSVQCFTAEKAVLDQTIHTQPCLFAVDLAAASALREQGIVPDMVAGFSLGEIPALAFAGCLDTVAAFQLVCLRAEAMQTCSNQHDTAMVAVLGLNHEIVERICQQFEVFPVNYNFQKQLVIAGDRGQLQLASQAVKEVGGKAVFLPVSGAFHTPYMAEAATKLEQMLSSFNFTVTSIPVYSNVTAKPYRDQVDFANLIAEQVRNPVLWQQTIENMAKAGATTFIEVGPGKTLSGFIRKIIPEAKTYHVENQTTLLDVTKQLNGGL